VGLTSIMPNQGSETENSNLATSGGVPQDVARGLKHHRLELR
jgi:hypothetical protein